MANKITDIIVIDDAIPKALFNIWREEVYNSNEWRYYPYTDYNPINQGVENVSEEHKLEDTPKFQLMYDVNNLTHLTQSIVDMQASLCKISSYEITRMRINALSNHREVPQHHPIHSDTPADDKSGLVLSCILYVNDSDGDTLFYSNETQEIVQRVSPKENRLLAFPAELLHSSSPPRDTMTRFMCNTVYTYNV